MCRLCGFAATNAEYLGKAEKMLASDLDRLLVTKAHAPNNPSVFTNIKDWVTLKLSFALFDPLTAFPNPKNYYQPIEVDGERLRVDWGSGWTRSLAFLPNGKILMYTKSTEREAFKQEEDWFRYYFLVEFDPSELEIICEPPKFILRADKVKVSGTNLLTYMPVEHTFSFSLSHLATEKSAMKADAARQSAFYREILARGAKQTGDASAGVGQKSDFERYLVTTMHFAPHPLFMLLSKKAGFETRFEMQNDVGEFLLEHLKPLAAKSKKPSSSPAPQ